MSAAAVIPAVAASGVAALILGLSCIGGSAQADSNAAGGTSVCATSGPVTGLSATAAANARIVDAVAEQAGGPPAAIIAIDVGLTESGLRALGNPNVSGAASTQGSGTNGDSVGIFQQRASWGTVAQRLDPALSTSLFITRLLAVPGWQTMPPQVAAQTVQVSAYDGNPRPANNNSSVVGGNYLANLGKATSIVAAVDAGTTATGTPTSDGASDAPSSGGSASCDTLTGGEPANPAPGSHGLPADYTIPATATPAEATVVAYALAQLDKPYVFGASGPDAFDCSGLTAAAWGQVGVHLAHYTGDQVNEGTPTTATAIVPGDLILVPGDDGTLAAPGHVGMYIGAGLVVNAADERDGIRVQTYADFIKVGHGLSAIRHVA